MPYTQTSIQEEMNIIDNRPFQHSSKKRHQVKARKDKIQSIVHPSLYLISLSLLTRAEWGNGLLTLSLLLTSHSSGAPTAIFGKYLFGRRFEI